LKILAVSTAEKECSLALTADRSVICEETWASRQTHSRRIMDMVARIMDRCSMSVHDLDGFAVARGPGSFTGLRIGISTVKGLSYAASKPCAGVSSLDCIAWQFSSSSLPVCVIMDARRGEVYHATYYFQNGKLLKKTREKALKPLEVLELLHGDTLFAGSGSAAYRGIIEKEFNKHAFFAPLFQNRVCAASIAHVIGQTASALTDENSAALLKPVYLRKSDAEINQK